MSRAAGASAEQLAAEFLVERGFQILERNFTVNGGELVLVCVDAGTRVLVVVRARTGDDFGAPEETITSTKKRRIILAAKLYLLTKQIEERACRFDVIAIEGDRITHIPDAFSA
jgi:putative endonuclease